MHSVDDATKEGKSTKRLKFFVVLSQSVLLFRFTDADGPTLVGDPDLGFAGLRQFGPTLIHHSQLKYRESHLNFMLVSFCSGTIFT